MVEDLITYLLTPASQLAIIIALAELVKKLGLNIKYIPLVDLFLGLVSGICVYGLMLGYGLANGIVLGIGLGLSSCGLFSGFKNVTKKDDE